MYYRMLPATIVIDVVLLFTLRASSADKKLMTLSLFFHQIMLKYFKVLFYSYMFSMYADVEVCRKQNDN